MGSKSRKSEGEIYLDQSALGLKLNVIDGVLNKSQFTLLEKDTITTKTGLTVKAAIIGGSHILTIKSESVGVHFHEVFACTDIKTESKLAYFGPLRKVSGKQDLIFKGDIYYTFSAQLLDWDPFKAKIDEIETKARKVGDQESSIGLIHDFPGKGKHIPKTIVLMEEASKGIEVKTIHSYPNENNLVLTTTNIRGDLK